MTTITVHSPARAAAPRAAAWAAQAFFSALGWFRRHNAEQAIRQARSERLIEAAAVREYAQRYARHDPRFTADLLAAADRHENAE
jgi:hypothetical protein